MGVGKVIIGITIAGAITAPGVFLIGMATPGGFVNNCSKQMEATEQTLPDVTFTEAQRTVAQTIIDANPSGEPVLSSIAVAAAWHTTALTVTADATADDGTATTVAINPFTGQESPSSIAVDAQMIYDQVTSLDTWTQTPPASLTAWVLGTPNADLTEQWFEAAALTAELEGSDIQQLVVMQTVNPLCLQLLGAAWDGEYQVLSGWAFPVPVTHHISSEFGYRHHPITGVWKLHAGIDIAADCGSPILAAKDGVISMWDETAPGYGTVIEVYHYDGTRTRYAHMYPGTLNFYLGAPVKQGDLLATVGAAGNSTGCHLHFEYYTPAGVVTNPRVILGATTT